MVTIDISPKNLDYSSCKPAILRASHCTIPSGRTRAPRALTGPQEPKFRSLSSKSSKLQELLEPPGGARSSWGVVLGGVSGSVGKNRGEWLWLVGGLEHDFYFSILLGMSSSQLTNIFPVGSNHQPDGDG